MPFFALTSRAYNDCDPKSREGPTSQGPLLRRERIQRVGLWQDTKAHDALVILSREQPVPTLKDVTPRFSTCRFRRFRRPVGLIPIRVTCTSFRLRFHSNDAARFARCRAAVPLNA